MSGLLFGPRVFFTADERVGRSDGFGEFGRFFDVPDLRFERRAFIKNRVAIQVFRIYWSDFIVR